MRASGDVETEIISFAKVPAISLSSEPPLNGM